MSVWEPNVLTVNSYLRTAPKIEVDDARTDL
jgi:hypothetical protein